MGLDGEEGRGCWEGTDGSNDRDEASEDGLYSVLMMDMVPHRPLGDFGRAQLEPKCQEFGLPWGPAGPYYIVGVPRGHCEGWE